MPTYIKKKKNWYYVMLESDCVIGDFPILKTMCKREAILVAKKINQKEFLQDQSKQ